MISITYRQQYEEGVGNLQRSGVIRTHGRGLNRDWFRQKNEDVAESQPHAAVYRCPFLMLRVEQMLGRSLIFEGAEEIRHGEYSDDGRVGGHGQVANALLLHQRHGVG
jgi:hypothetical protein